MTIKKEILDELIKDYRNPEDLLSENGLLKQLTKQLLERARQAELTHQIGYSKNEFAPDNQANRRNGTTPEKVKSSHGVRDFSYSRSSSASGRNTRSHETSGI